jgi:rhodanese-related sulfurtransferase
MPSAPQKSPQAAEAGGVADHERIGPGGRTMAAKRTDEPFERVDTAAGKKLFDDKSVRWIDVREAAEWRQVRIPGAVLVPLNRLLISPRQYLQGEGVLFYCAQGIRSAVACELAAAIGLSQIYNLEGGIEEWLAQGYPVERCVAPDGGSGGCP